MPVVYVREQGAYVRKVGEHLTVEKNGKVLSEIPIHTLTSLSVIGNVQISTQAIHFLMQAGIDIGYFKYSGEYLGQISAPSSKNIFLRFSQYQIYLCNEKRLEFAKAIVRNKLQNQITVIKKFHWETVVTDAKEELRQIIELQNTINDKQTNNELMGVEGMASKLYFSAYAMMFKSELKFVKRTKHPPKDPVNIILSLGYTLLTKEIAAVLDAEAFESYIGFLHGIRYGRKSLPCDIVEEFRQPVVDRLTLNMFNKRMLGADDFYYEESKVYLSEEGFKKYIRAYEKWMNDSSSGRSFRTIIRDQITELKSAVRNKRLYVPYEWKAENVSGDL